MKIGKISIIIPAFNVQDYIKECLESIINQTYRNIEIIVINDGSTDKTSDIIQSIAKKDSRIKFINHLHKKGVSSARNEGIKIAQGEYIGFVDSDDFIEKNYFEVLYNALKNNDCDIACATIIRKRTFTEKFRIKYTQEKVFSTLEEKIKACELPRCCYVWNKLYKAELIKDSFFKEGVIFEDILWLPEILKKSSKLVTATGTKYYYRVNKNSLVKAKPSAKTKIDNFNAKRYIVKFFTENNLQLSEKEKNFEKKVFKIGMIKFNIRRHKLSNKEIRELNFKYEIKNSLEKYPKLLSRYGTLDVLKTNNNSLCRFGDGEFNLIWGESINFQEYSPELSKKLKEILISNKQNVMVAIPDIFGNLDNYTQNAVNFWRKYLVYNRNTIYSYLDFSKQYFDSFLSRPYLETRNKENIEQYFEKMKQIWDAKKVVFVEGKYSRLGVNNDLFNNCFDIKRIICPSKNAFDKYEAILETCKKQDKDVLFIIALGPTATVLAYDLANAGYRALDLGHIDIEYEWFLKKATEKIPVKNKMVNECHNGRKEVSINDPKYISEIIGEI